MFSVLTGRPVATDEWVRTIYLHRFHYHIFFVQSCPHRVPICFTSCCPQAPSPSLQPAVESDSGGRYCWGVNPGKDSAENISCCCSLLTCSTFKQQHTLGLPWVMTYAQSAQHTEQSSTPLRVWGFQTNTCLLQPQKASVQEKSPQMEREQKHPSINKQITGYVTVSFTSWPASSYRRSIGSWDPPQNLAEQPTEHVSGKSQAVFEAQSEENTSDPKHLGDPAEPGGSRLCYHGSEDMSTLVVKLRLSLCSSFHSPHAVASLYSQASLCWTDSHLFKFAPSCSKIKAGRCGSLDDRPSFSTSKI